MKTGQLMPPLQRKWMQAIQRRVGTTTEIVGSMKGVKMSGLSATVRDQIQGLRDFELDESKKFRRMQILPVHNDAPNHLRGLRRRPETVGRRAPRRGPGLHRPQPARHARQPRRRARHDPEQPGVRDRVPGPDPGVHG
ncbi:hypothetical protein LY76DRAFT_588554 [Colletotrichum caudatum]|nr:hypothetical protein LY76DRAFT_588554 [Colletotrichum caudatum]